MTGLALSKPWIPLALDAITAVPAQLGVFEIADETKTVVHIGYAGGRELFGLRSALTAALDERTGAGLAAGYFRYELTHGYLTRWEELLMVHRAIHGRLPSGNAGHRHRLGRLTIDGSDGSTTSPPDPPSR